MIQNIENEKQAKEIGVCMLFTTKCSKYGYFDLLKGLFNDFIFGSTDRSKMAIVNKKLSKKLRTLKVNGNSELEKVPCTPHVKSVNNPFKVGKQKRASG